MPKKTQTKTVEKQQDEHAAHMEKRCRYIEQRLKIVRGNGGYFVVAVPGLKDGPCDVLYGPLLTPAPQRAAGQPNSCARRHMDPPG